MRALISVYDKTNILKIATYLSDKGYEIISTGGSYEYLKQNNIDVTSVSDITCFEEILDGRVKTLHPFIHGAILNKRDDLKHQEVINKHGIKHIDIVIVNLYPFEENLNNNLSLDEMIELIDIGGPTLLRSAAKNYQDVLVVSDPLDYDNVISYLDNSKKDKSFNLYLSTKAFNLTAHYDSVISQYLINLSNNKDFKYENITLNNECELRYGENPHQSAKYVSFDNKIGFNNLDILHGKQLSYNNYLDVDASLNILCDFKDNVLFSLKHGNPCSIAVNDNVENLFDKVYKVDPVSIFGGIVACNMIITKQLALKLNSIFLEIIIAKDYEEDALAILKEKKNLRIIKYHDICNNNLRYQSVMGGLLIQQQDYLNPHEYTYQEVGNTKNEIDMSSIHLANTCVKHLKSNAICLVSDNVVVGIGTGQVNRILSAKLALEQAKDYTNLVLASDAFLPFDDIVVISKSYGVKTIVQPGGSINDQVVIKQANDLEIAMLFTNTRNFRH